MAIHVMYPEVTIALVTFVIVCMILRSLKQDGKTIPGPWGFPIVGNIFQLGEFPHISLTQMKKLYGDVFRINLGQVPVIVVSGQETIKKVLCKQGESFAARPKLYTILLMADSSSLSFSTQYGESWKLHKKIAKNALRTFSKSEAKSSACSCLLEEYISAEAVELVKTLLDQSEKNGYFNPANEITYAVANVMCALCFGKRYEHTDKDFIRVIQVSDEAQKSAAASGAMADFIPLVRYLPLPGLKALVKIISTFRDFIKERVDEHYATYDENHLRDVTDGLISLCVKKKLKHTTLTDKQIVSTVEDLFGAGFDTVSTALQWIFLYLLHLPETQIKIQAEIDEKIGGNRLPRFEDRKETHYTEAFINEVLRHSSFTPFTLPHCTTADVYLNGYFIPKDTCVFINQYQVNHDPSIWENPDSFVPERFLDENGHFVRSCQERVHIFGMGVRVCIGEDIARNQIFLILTTILQRLKIEHNLQEKLDFTPKNGIALKPTKYNLKAELRK